MCSKVSLLHYILDMLLCGDGPKPEPHILTPLSLRGGRQICIPTFETILCLLSGIGAKPRRSLLPSPKSVPAPFQYNGSPKELLVQYGRNLLGTDHIFLVPLNLKPWNLSLNHLQTVICNFILNVTRSERCLSLSPGVHLPVNFCARRF